MGEEARPKLLHLIPDGRVGSWDVIGDGGRKRESFGVAGDEKLELRLGLPSREDWPVGEMRGEDSRHSAHSLGFLSIDASSEAKREAFQQQPEQSFATRNAALPTHINSQTSRSAAATGPVVGWPPIRSFRRNLASSAKPSPEPKNGSSDTSMIRLRNTKKGFFVKINMDGIPIGRKIDLKAYDSYDKLSLAVDELFLDLAAQKDPAAAESMKNSEENKLFSSLLDGDGDYTLVYEDDEGDRMLVGDVPWDMFVSTAKRLRVLKSSELAGSPL